jgi:Holliday junction resolvase RusA-like endonuclease
MRPHVERIARATGCKPLCGRIRQTVRVCWPTNGVHANGEPYTEPPGYDGWVSVLNDLCQSCGVIASDCHIFDAHVYKVWADPAGVFVRFEEVP